MSIKKRHELFKVVNDKNEINSTKEWVGQSVALGLQKGPVMVSIGRPRRTLDQNDHFHAICRELENLKVPYAGKPRTVGEWKVLLVSAHAQATINEFGVPQEIVEGLEGEPVQLRESTSNMSKERKSSLIEYSRAFLEEQRTEVENNAHTTS